MEFVRHIGFSICIFKSVYPLPFLNPLEFHNAFGTIFSNRKENRSFQFPSFRFDFSRFPTTSEFPLLRNFQDFLDSDFGFGSVKFTTEKFRNFIWKLISKGIPVFSGVVNILKVPLISRKKSKYFKRESSRKFSLLSAKIVIKRTFNFALRSISPFPSYIHRVQGGTIRISLEIAPCSAGSRLLIKITLTDVQFWNFEKVMKIK